jgi:hypothetical protein
MRSWKADLFFHTVFYISLHFFSVVITIRVQLPPFSFHSHVGTEALPCPAGGGRRTAQNSLTIS